VGHERVSAHVAYEVLHRPLLVAARRRAEVRVEQVVGPKRTQPLVLDAIRSRQDLGHRGLGIVVPDLAEHTAEELEGGDVAGEQGLEPLGG